MNTSQNDKKRTQSENRYNFNQPTFDSSRQDWQIPDPHSNAAQPEQDDQLWHQPAPMQKRADMPKRKRNPHGGRWSTFTIVTLIGLVSFTFVVDLAGGGKLRHLLLAYLASPSRTMVVTAKPVVPVAPPVVKIKPNPPQVAQIPQPVAQVPVLPEVMPEPLVKAAPIVAQILQGQVVRDCADCPELIAVSAGSFMRKSESNPNDPPHQVSIYRGFAIGRNAITFQDWQKCVNDRACSPIADDAGWGRGNRPLIFVSFDDVTSQYLPWLSKLTGNEYRLPSKDEWQYAALGGKGGAEKTTNQIRDPSLDCFNASGPHVEGCTDTFDGTSPVGSFAANTLGLNDMKGNVWAWSADCWQPFTNAPSAKSDACAMRVLLGGAWSTNRNDVTATFSGWEKSSKKANSIGFRVVRNLP